MAVFFVMFGNHARRHWADAQKYGFISAGGGPRWSSPLLRLSTGDEVLVYVPKAGYVGRGTVLAESVPIRDFTVGPGQDTHPLLKLPLSSPGLADDVDDDLDCEYVVRIQWDKTVGIREAYWRPGLFFRRTTVWPFDDEAAAQEIRKNL